MKEIKVIKILDRASIIINAGEKDGIGTGDMFFITAHSESIIDPFTKENLGSIKQYKAKIEATQVYEKMSVCQNADRTKSLAAVAQLFTTEKREPLNIDPSDIPSDYDNSSPIQIGDIVERIE